MTQKTSFQLSRIYASGWTSGRQCDAEDPAELDRLVERINPHLLTEERERWAQGFLEAAGHRRQHPFRKGLGR